MKSRWTKRKQHDQHRWPHCREGHLQCRLADLIAKQAPLGVRATLENARIDDFQEAKKHLAAQLPKIMASEDAQEGVMSFMERREAKFKGR